LCTYSSATVVQQNEGTPQHIGSRKLNLAKLLGDTFSLYGRHFGIMCVVGLIFVGIPVIFEIFGTVAANPVFDTQGIFNEKNTLFSILGSLVGLYVLIWAIRQCLHTARGGTNLLWNQMFPSFGMFLKMFVLSFILNFAIVCGVLPAFALVGISFMDNPPIAIPIILACAVGVAFLPCYILTRLWLAPCFFVDRNMGIIDSMNNAWRASSGNFWKLFTSITVLFICTFWGAMVFFIPAYAFAGVEDGSISAAILITVGSVFSAPILFLGSCLAYWQLTERFHIFDRENESEESEKIDDWRQASG